jgi:hypothetical protein
MAGRSSRFADLITKRPGGRGAAPAHRSVRDKMRTAKRRGMRKGGR